MTNDYEIRGDYAFIFIKKSRGRGTRKTIVTVIDLVDLEKAMSLKGAWTTRYTKKTETHYAYGYLEQMPGKKSNKTVELSRFLFGDIPDGLVVDHKNHDTLDNRRSVNIRVVTPFVNRHNRKKKRVYPRNKNHITLFSA